MRRLLGGLVVALAATACGGGSDDTQTVTVFAAASLTDVFGDLEPVFEDAHPGVDLRFNFAGSSDLAQQIVNGAPADVFAAADETQMQVVVDGGLVVDGPHPFATNRLAIVVPSDNPAGVESLTDLADESLLLVICAPQVPCGAAAQTMATDAGVDLRPDSEESDVRSVLAKVQSGEADAGLVWVTDVASAEGVESVDILEGGSAATTYPIAAMTRPVILTCENCGPHTDLAVAFVEFVLGPIGRRALADAGFGAP